MVDLVVPAGATLTIDQNYAVAPRYDLFSMEDNAKIVVAVDLVLRANRAQFGANCTIDAQGAAGAAGAPGPGGQGARGGDGGPGQKGRNVTIEAALAKVGGLTLVTDGGSGGAGGFGGGGGGIPVVDLGQGGAGGAGGDAGQISLTWVRATPQLPTAPGAAPNGHIYRSNGGPGGSGGQGGPGGPAGASGKTLAPEVLWRADIGQLLWVQAQEMGPAPRNGHGVAFDPGRGKLVLFGGLVDGKPAGDTWEWDGKLWSQVADMGPEPRAYHGMSYDPAGGRVLVFGGDDPGANGGAGPNLYLGDTWGWDGEDWIQLADAGPIARRMLAMAADPVRQRVVLFGGEQPGGQAAEPVLSDTWEWDGAVWTQLADKGPAARFLAQLAYDEAAAVLVLFGGGGGGVSGDTWAWDGQHWTQVANRGPSPRTSHAMAAADQAVFMFGGLPNLADAQGKSAPLCDTWAWQGGAWRQIQDMGPPPRSGHAMARVTDANGERIILFGGQGAAMYQDTWRLVQRP